MALCDAGEPVCVTGTQLRSLLKGSVLGSSTQPQSTAAAGTLGSGVDIRAPAATPAGGTSGAPIIISNGGNPATATTTPANDPRVEASEAQAEPGVATEPGSDQREAEPETPAEPAANQSAPPAAAEVAI